MNKDEDGIARKAAKKLAEKNRAKAFREAMKGSTLVLPKSDFKFKKGISDKTRVVIHDYTGMLEIDRVKIPDKDKHDPRKNNKYER